ncbi:hypothetical protein A0H76_145 [Hepatospora eriocheir]|uniref:Uncharacterized protein n=1 Tax=Hepatospora eriocheir TaxID=1081669 RepID=A0A1X0QLB0_9MICR|nr:hypothetical protein A0H76_145 [Hepatospora eriocheir]
MAIQGTIFRTKDNLEEMNECANNNPEYTKIYINKRVVEGNIKKTFISINKNNGEDLYIVSKFNYADFKEYFTSESNFNKIVHTPNKKRVEKVDLKKLKQTNLSSLFSRK